MNRANHLAIILFVSFFVSCQSGSKKTENTSSKEAVEIEPTEDNHPEEVEAVPIAPEDRNNLMYQTGKQTWEKENSTKLPKRIDLKLLYDETDPTIEFGSILQSFENHFLILFYSGTDVENNYYATFDMNGNLLDATLFATRAYGDDFTTEFVHNNLIKVIHFHEEGFEIDEEGNSTYDDLSIEGNYIYLKENGLFQSINTNNSKTITTEIDSLIFNYYKDKINRQFPKENYTLFPFDKIPGNNTSSTDDVYESLEGGGLYSSCLEIRDSINNLIGIIGYTNEKYADSIPRTFSFVLNINPIIHYGIISVDGSLYLELVRLLPEAHKNTIQITKEYYVYPHEDQNMLIQTPIHTISGSLDELFGKPLGKDDIEILK